MKKAPKEMQVTLLGISFLVGGAMLLGRAGMRWIESSGIWCTALDGTIGLNHRVKRRRSPGGAWLGGVVPQCWWRVVFIGRLSRLVWWRTGFVGGSAVSIWWRVLLAWLLTVLVWWRACLVWWLVFGWEDACGWLPFLCGVFPVGWFDLGCAVAFGCSRGRVRCSGGVRGRGGRRCRCGFTALGVVTWWTSHHWAGMSQRG